MKQVDEWRNKPVLFEDRRISKEGRRVSTCSSDWCVLAPSICHRSLLAIPCCFSVNHSLTYKHTFLYRETHKLSFSQWKTKCSDRKTLGLHCVCLGRGDVRDLAGGEITLLLSNKYHCGFHPVDRQSGTLYILHAPASPVMSSVLRLQSEEVFLHFLVSIQFRDSYGKKDSRSQSAHALQLLLPNPIYLPWSTRQGSIIQLKV